MDYTPNELRMLWHLKRNGPLVREGNQSLLGQLAYNLSLSVGSTRTILRNLEQRCLVLRSYKYPQPHRFSEGKNNPLLKIELVDPDMALPPVPPLPLAVVVARENEELAERCAVEPSVEHMVDALIDRALELQKQVDKLQDVIAGLAAENDRLRHPAQQSIQHITQRVRDALTPDQWDELRKK